MLSIKLKSRIFLAPMHKVNDIAFRILCKKAGAGLVYTGMLNPLSKQKIQLNDKPAVQIFTSSEQRVREFIKKYEKKASLFDLNLGCPSYRASKHQMGFFLQDLKVVEKILKAMKKATQKPITIKIRKSNQIKKLVKLAEKYCSAIAIHPRIGKKDYSYRADVDFALRIKRRTRLPVIYSGDVNEDNAKKLLEKFDYVMIGRAAIGNPNIFSKLTGKRINFNFKDYYNLAKKYKLDFEQIKFQAMNFTKGMKNASKIRQLISKAKIEKELISFF
jgi:tRNA-dihydrouridine synthase